MVKKSYVMPVSNETRTRLRTGLLVGSGNTGAGADPSSTATTGTIGDNGATPIVGGNGQIGDARRRSVSSVD